MRTSSGADITVDGDTVVKVHRTGTDPRALAARLRVAARLGDGFGGPLLAPLATEPEPAPGGRWLTRWPRVATVDRDGGRLPWAEAGAVLASLHCCDPGDGDPGDGDPDPGDGVPGHRAVERLRGALDRLPDGAPDVIGSAAGTLSARAWQPAPPGRPITLVHGDFHLGQLGCRPGGRWQLIDIDDLGVGDPAWDLARPAGLWAAGLIPHRDWHGFIDAYRDGGGPALPATGDPWVVLEPLARAAVVHAAAVGARRRADESQRELLAACRRMLAQLEKNSLPNPPLR